MYPLRTWTSSWELFSPRHAIPISSLGMAISPESDDLEAWIWRWPYNLVLEIFGCIGAIPNLSLTRSVSLSDQPRQSNGQPQYFHFGDVECSFMLIPNILFHTGQFVEWWYCKILTWSVWGSFLLGSSSKLLVSSTWVHFDLSNFLIFKVGQ